MPREAWLLTDFTAREFFGVQRNSSPITRDHVPLLAFFGTRDDVGSQGDLGAIVAAIRRRKGGLRVTTALIDGAAHKYAGQEEQLAKVVANRVAGVAKGGPQRMQ